MQPIHMIYLDRTENYGQTGSRQAPRKTNDPRQRTTLGRTSGMTLQSDMLEGMLQWLQSSVP